eukprot:TRINITY_DN794_c0_g1_i1.p1 TRINITY_DN794_c0_g1~~TRINITY_DN794_c0_g1_i1.p1  ORF type:complete len:316 (+),score=60.87 TRINITY_DN794_c0_g1_i1:121-948(+)
MTNDYGPPYDDARKLQSCTGTLIHPYFVMTAGHCIWNHGTNPANYKIFAGSQTLGEGISADRTSPNGYFVPVANMFRHPDFYTHWTQLGPYTVADIYLNDIGLIQLAEPILDIEPARLVERDESTPSFISTGPDAGDLLTIAGYGFTDRANSTLVRPLQELTELVLSYAQATQAFASIGFSNFQFSASHILSNSNGNICNGDSGCAATIEKNGVTYLAGVCSATLPDCTGPTLLTRVSTHLGWIKSVIAAFEKPSSGGPCSTTVNFNFGGMVQGC